MASQITGFLIVCSTVCSSADQRKHLSSVSLVLMRGIHRRPMDSPHKGPATRKTFPFDDVIIMDKNAFFLHDQHHGCWWPGDDRSQSTSNHGIDIVISEYSAPEVLNHVHRVHVCIKQPFKQNKYKTFSQAHLDQYCDLRVTRWTTQPTQENNNANMI